MLVRYTTALIVAAGPGLALAQPISPDEERAVHKAADRRAAAHDVEGAVVLLDELRARCEKVGNSACVSRASNHLRALPPMKPVQPPEERSVHEEARRRIATKDNEGAVQLLTRLRARCTATGNTPCVERVTAHIAAIVGPHEKHKPVSPEEEKRAHEGAEALRARGDFAGAIRDLEALQARCGSSAACAAAANKHLQAVKMERDAPAAVVALRGRRRYDEAADQLRRAQSACVDDACRARMSVLLAQTYRDGGDAKKAVTELERAVPGLDREPALQARARVQLAELYERQRQPQRALAEYASAANQFQAARDPAAQARALSAMATIQLDLGKRSDALESLGRAKRIYRDVGDKERVAEVDHRMAELQSQAVQPPPPPTVELHRYPTVHAPKAVEVGRSFPVRVALTDVLDTPDVRAAGETTPDGQLVFRLPAADKSWRISVSVSAPPCDVLDEIEKEIVVQREKGRSSTAVFELRCEAEPGLYSLWVTFQTRGRYIGKAVRSIEVVAPGALAQSDGVLQATAAEQREIRHAVLTDYVDSMPPDASLRLRWRHVAEDAEHDWKHYHVEADIVGAHTKWVVQRELVVIPEKKSAGDLDSFVTRAFSEMASAAVSRSGHSDSDVPGAAKDSSIRAAQAFGTTLWDDFVPEALKGHFVEIDRRAQKGVEPGKRRLLRIQILTDNPVLPWELVEIVDSQSVRRPFLGMEAALARSYETNVSSCMNASTIKAGWLATIRPRYKPPLPFQTFDVPTTVKTKFIDGTVSALDATLREQIPIGILHFAGHGSMADDGGGRREFMLVLEDEVLLPARQWRGFFTGARSKEPFFLFLNACHMGAGAIVDGRMEGWANEARATGAEGFVSGLWPVAADSAADFAHRFYAETLSRKPDRRATVAEALASVRRNRFYETGDPTYLAYVFYGHVDLRLEVPTGK